MYQSYGGDGHAPTNYLDGVSALLVQVLWDSNVGLRFDRIVSKGDTRGVSQDPVCRGLL